jgi:hypothetical protein
MTGHGGFCKGGRGPVLKFPQFIGIIGQFGLGGSRLAGLFEPDMADRRRLSVGDAKSAKGLQKGQLR